VSQPGHLTTVDRAAGSLWINSRVDPRSKLDKWQMDQTLIPWQSSP